MSSSTEDTMCTRCIQWANEWVERSAEMGDDVSAEIEVEKHYNYYGDRGVADLFVRETDNDASGVQNDHIYEFKSDAAIESATGANEILRQFNRMCTYFYKDERITLPKTSAWSSSWITFELSFNATPAAYNHVMENLDIYQSLSTPEVDSPLRDAKAIVAFRSGEFEGSVLVASSTGAQGLDREIITGMFEREFPGVLPNEGDSR